jgi:hypothetical protein
LLLVTDKIKRASVVVALLGIFIVVDLWGVDRRYLNNDNFVAPERVALHPTPTEQLTDQVAAANGDTDFRIYDLTVNTFNDSRPSAFHNQIGGYSAAKLRRYQDLIDFYLGSRKFFDYVNSDPVAVIGNIANTPLLSVSQPYPVLDMLNCRYFMRAFGEGQTYPVRRSTALGPCWFVSNIKPVDDANAEILELNSFDPAITAIVDRSKFDIPIDKIVGPIDSSETITLIHTYPQTSDLLTYKSHTNADHLAVFSEVFYAPDWRAYIDDQPVDILRVNYILRALVVPAGDHTIRFVNEAPTLHRLDNITLVISIIMLLAMATAIYLVYRKNKGKMKETEK